MDGLIFDTEGLYKISWQHAASEQGFELDDDFYQSFIGVQDAECERRVAVRFGEGLDLERFKAVRNRDFIPVALTAIPIGGYICDKVADKQQAECPEKAAMAV